LKVNADTQLLGSPVMNLLTNAFKYSRAGGRVILRAYKLAERLLIEVEDQCGGIPDTAGDPFRAFGDQPATIRQASGSGSRLPGRPSRHTVGISLSGICLARDASS
jgi:signal transduction histidine kinase